MEGAEPDAFGPFPRGLHHPTLHFACGFVRESEAQNIFAAQRSIAFEQLANALGDYASLSCSRARDYQHRTFAMLDGRALLRVEGKTQRRYFFRVCDWIHEQYFS